MTTGFKYCDNDNTFDSFCRVTSLMVKEKELNFKDYMNVTQHRDPLKHGLTSDLLKDNPFMMRKINDRLRDFDQGFTESYPLNDDQFGYKVINGDYLNESIKKKLMFYEQQYYESLRSLSIIIKTMDQYVAGHCERVALYAMLIGTALDIPAGEMIILLYSALFHDVGKLVVSEAILNKKGKLTDIEYDEMKKHSRKGYDILKFKKAHDAVCETVLHHHERYDGKGYPDGLKGDKIPKLSRIIGVADAFDAMTSDRSYRRGMSYQQAKTELLNNKGTQFDPLFVDIFAEKINLKYGGTI